MPILLGTHYTGIELLMQDLLLQFLETNLRYTCILFDEVRMYSYDSLPPPSWNRMAWHVSLFNIQYLFGREPISSIELHWCASTCFVLLVARRQKDDDDSIVCMFTHYYRAWTQFQNILLHWYPLLISDIFAAILIAHLFSSLNKVWCGKLDKYILEKINEYWEKKGDKTVE